MKYLFLIWTFSAAYAFGQCDNQYPSGLYHKGKFIAANGDTMNNVDSAGLYHGWHVYTDNPNGIFSISNTYILGKFNHGIPVGIWEDHCKDSSMSFGQFDVGDGEFSFLPDGTRVYKKQGIYRKKGKWSYYGADSILKKEEFYSLEEYKNGWEIKIYRRYSSKFILIHYRSSFRYNSVFRKEQITTYSDSGLIQTNRIEDIWGVCNMVYYDNGKVNTKYKCRKLLGLRLNRYVLRSYSREGKLIKKEKGKCRRPIVNEDW